MGEFATPSAAAWMLGGIPGAGLGLGHDALPKAREPRSVERDAVARVVVAGFGEGAVVRRLHHHFARTGVETPAVPLDMLHGLRSVET